MILTNIKTHLGLQQYKYDMLYFLWPHILFLLYLQDLKADVTKVRCLSIYIEEATWVPH